MRLAQKVSTAYRGGEHLSVSATSIARKGPVNGIRRGTQWLVTPSRVKRGSAWWQAQPSAARSAWRETSRRQPRRCRWPTTCSWDTGAWAPSALEHASADRRRCAAAKTQPMSAPRAGVGRESGGQAAKGMNAGPDGCGAGRWAAQASRRCRVSDATRLVKRDTQGTQHTRADRGGRRPGGMQSTDHPQGDRRASA